MWLAEIDVPFRLPLFLPHTVSRFEGARLAMSIADKNGARREALKSLLSQTFLVNTFRQAYTRQDINEDGARESALLGCKLHLTKSQQSTAL